MKENTNNKRINLNYGQPTFDDDTLLLEENAEIVEMKKQYMAKQRMIKVKGALLPYIREGSKIVARATGGDIQTVMYAAGHVDKNTTLHYIRAVKSDVQTDKIKQCFG